MPETVNKFVRTIVPGKVHDNVTIIAAALHLTIPRAYTYILTRALWDVDPLDYAKTLRQEAAQARLKENENDGN